MCLKECYKPQILPSEDAYTSHKNNCAHKNDQTTDSEQHNICENRIRSLIKNILWSLFHTSIFCYKMYSFITYTSLRTTHA